MDIAAYTLGGRAANEARRDGGRVYHAVRVGSGYGAAALCGKRPGKRSYGWEEDSPGKAVTCPRCLLSMATADQV